MQLGERTAARLIGTWGGALPSTTVVRAQFSLDGATGWTTVASVAPSDNAAVHVDVGAWANLPAPFANLDQSVWVRVVTELGDGAFDISIHGVMLELR